MVFFHKITMVTNVTQHQHRVFLTVKMTAENKILTKEKLNSIWEVVCSNYQKGVCGNGEKLLQRNLESNIPLKHNFLNTLKKQGSRSHL
jgi:hypothetical protein